MLRVALPGAILVVLLMCWSGIIRAAPVSEILSQRDCFAEFRSYDQWMAYLRGKNGFFKSLLIRQAFPRDDFNRYQRKLDCRAIRYRSGQHVVSGWLVQPKHANKGGKLPVIIYNRGGNRGFGALTFGHLFSHVFPFAEQGYMVVASQYRGLNSPQDSSSSPDQFGGDDVRDVTNLVRIAARLPRADPRNLFMIGQSRGAMMTFRALLETPLPIRAVAIYSGIYDLHDLLRFRPEFGRLFEALIPDYRKNQQAELDRRSVTQWPRRLPPQTGVLMIHGDEDESAPLASAQKLADRLKKIGRPHKLVVYSGESHFLDGVRPQVHLQTLQWFRKYQWREPVVSRANTSR